MPERTTGPTRGRPAPGASTARGYAQRLNDIRQQLDELRDQNRAAQRYVTRPSVPARGPVITDPADPRYVPPPLRGHELASAQARSSRSARQRIEEREQAADHLRRLRYQWHRLAWALTPPDLPDPSAALAYLNEYVETTYGSGPRWAMEHRADVARMREALEFGDYLRQSPGAAALYGVARLAGYSASEAEAITNDPGYELTLRALSAMGVDDDDAEDMAVLVAVVAALVELALSFRRGRRPVQRTTPRTTSRTPSGPTRRGPNRQERRAAAAIARRAPGRDRRRAEREAREANSPRARRRRRRLARARARERREQEARDQANLPHLRREAARRLPHPNAAPQIPDLQRSRGRDWGWASPTPDEVAAEYERYYEARQGFSGVYDPATGRIYMRPSAPNRNGEFGQPVPPDWVPRGGGHELIAVDLHNARRRGEEPRITSFDADGQRALPRHERMRAFTLIRRGDGYEIGWLSTSVNGNNFHHGDTREVRHLPHDLRGEVRDALLHHAGVIARDEPTRPNARRVQRPRRRSQARPRRRRRRSIR